MRILICGGNSFIARDLIKKLTKKDDIPLELTIITRRATLLSQEFPDLKLSIVEADLSYLDWDKISVGSVDFIVYCAADVSFYGGRSTYNDNINPFKRTIESLQGNFKGKFIYLSTLGALDRNLKEKITAPLVEVSDYNPTSYYGKSKRDSEIILKNIM